MFFLQEEPRQGVNMNATQINETVATLHVFTTHADGIKCSCGAEVTDINGSWQHTLDMRAAASLIQNEKAVEEIRSTPEVVTDPASTCVNCGEAIHYSGHVNSANAHHVHTATGERQCSTEAFNLANPVPHCPKCHSVRAWDIYSHAWGVSSNCTDCGGHTYEGIGD